VSVAVDGDRRTDGPPLGRAGRWVLVGIAVLLGAALSGYRLLWGLDDRQFFFDESIWSMRIDPRSPPEVRRAPGIALVYPTLYEYATRGVLACTAAPTADGRALGAVMKDPDPAFLAPIAAARTTSALAWVVAVVAVAAVGRRFYGDAVAAAAALLFATSPTGVLQVHLAAVDPLLATIGVLVLLAAWHLACVPSAATSLAAGGLAGLGFATKYTGLGFVAPVTWACVEAARSTRGIRPLPLLLAVAGAGIVLGAVIGCPRCALDPRGVWSMLAWHEALARTAPFDGNRLAESVGWYARPWIYQLVALFPFMLGLPTHLLALGGVVVAARERRLGDRLLAAFLVPYFAVVGAATATFERQLLPLVPGMALLAARATMRLRPPWLAWLVLGLATAYSTALAFTHVDRLSWNQQAEVARFISERTTEAGGRVDATPVAFANYEPYIGLLEALKRAGLAAEPRAAESGSRRRRRTSSFRNGMRRRSGAIDAIPRCSAISMRSTPGHTAIVRSSICRSSGTCSRRSTAGSTRASRIPKARSASASTRASRAPVSTISFVDRARGRHIRARRMRIHVVVAVGVLLVVSPVLAKEKPRPFPKGFQWGTAISGFQSDMGVGAPNDEGTDWWAWVRDPANVAAGRVSGDLPENGPGFWQLFEKDAKLVRKKLHGNAFRMGIEWSRIFPVSTASVDTSGGIDASALAALDAIADQSAVEHYRDVFAALRKKKLRPLVTLNHFSLPLWLHDPIEVRDAFVGVDPLAGPVPGGIAHGGWLDPVSVVEFEKLAAYCAWKFGDLVDFWATLNEPVVVIVSGFVNAPGVGGNFPPGIFSFAAVVQVIPNLVAAHARGYDALHAWDTVDADGDGTAVDGRRRPQHRRLPSDEPEQPERRGRCRAWRLSLQPGLSDRDRHRRLRRQPRRRHDDAGEQRADLAGRSDFLGVNYYLRATATGLGASVTPLVPLFDFIPGPRTGRRGTRPAPHVRPRAPTSGGRSTRRACAKS
jgi:beta-glucosidase/6-phospho-beta-glucosidase/beta-galactosidase